MSNTTSGDQAPFRELRKRGSKVTKPYNSDEEMESLTDEERRNWKGWVELESEPALFNYILRSYGVQDVKIKEVFNLDQMSELPKPVYGLIFLFRYHNDDADQVADIPPCPRHVWFANQTTENACATVALLNIVMNVPQIILGDALSAFKASTANLKPAHRGKLLDSNDFIRAIHNSFARKMDIMNADLILSQAYDKWIRSKNTQSTSKAGVRSRATATKASHKRKYTKAKPKEKVADEEAGYHYVAYIPIDGAVWRLDGLQKQPVKIGPTGHDWLHLAHDNIQQRIHQYQEEGIDISLMSLCRSPLGVINNTLVHNLKAIEVIEQLLATQVDTWSASSEFELSSDAIDLRGFFGISQEMVDSIIVTDSRRREIDQAKADIHALLVLRSDIDKELTELKDQYIQEIAEVQQENELAEMKKHDHTPKIYNSMRMAAKSGMLKDIALELTEISTAIEP